MTQTMPVNSPPAAMLRIAETAVLRGLDKVHLGYESLGADFPAPIGWQYHLTHVSADPDRRHFLRVTCQEGDSEPEAFVGDLPNVTYWHEEEILDWIAGAPDPDALEADRNAKTWELIQRAHLNGWEVTREIRRAEHALFARFAELRGMVPDPLPVQTIEVSALNWFYNTSGHPQHHSTGAPVSVGASLVSTGESFLHLDGNEGDLVFAGAAEFEAVVAEPARWFVPVARYDEDAEKWVLPAAATAWQGA